MPGNVIQIGPKETIPASEPLPLDELWSVRKRLLIPNQQAAVRMARELLISRGVKDPDEA
jgi:hypothetical protein